MSTNGLGVLQRYNIQDDSSGAVDNSHFDGLIIGVSLDAGASSQTAVLGDLSQIVLQVRGVDPDNSSQTVVVNEFTPKLNG